MTEKNVQEILLDVIENKLNIPLERERIDGNTLLGDEGLYLDSIRLIELVARIEEQFGVVIPDHELAELANANLERLVAIIVGRAEVR
ncbi:acyl carrier protein [Cohnella boryungensis]|uniref:Acyl carrier protein n=1 Tax=Cohnella boryungensis TaxID=768479 RepID=A0ABV8SE62_9BACL